MKNAYSSLGLLIFVATLAFYVNAGIMSHSHSSSGNVHNKEREGDGAYSPRDHSHFSESGEHHNEFDHEAILGSHKEAEEYDHLSPDEAKRRLRILLKKMDLNSDERIDRHELKAWILRSFKMLSQEEAQERLEDADEDNNGIVTWSEYLIDAYGVDEEDPQSLDAENDQQPSNAKPVQDLDENSREVVLVGEPLGGSDLILSWLITPPLVTLDKPPEYYACNWQYLKIEIKVGSVAINGVEGIYFLIADDKLMWKAADTNNDGVLDPREWVAFSHPEEHPSMIPIILEQTLRDKDKDKDGGIDFQEFVGDRAQEHDKDWLKIEKDKFDYELDKDKDGRLTGNEIMAWIVPSNEDIAEEEVEHLFAASDDDHNEVLSFNEVLEHHDTFVGSEATDYGDHLHNIHHFEDEL